MAGFATSQHTNSTVYHIHQPTTAAYRATFHRYTAELPWPLPRAPRGSENEIFAVPNAATRAKSAANQR